MDLSDQTAIVTGASRGIGLAIASTLVGRGASVALWSRHEEGAAAAAESIASNSPGQVVGRAVDVRRRHEVEDAAAAAARELGPITLLVNNAGTAGPAGPDGRSIPISGGSAWRRVCAAPSTAHAPCFRECSSAVRGGSSRR